MPDMTDAEILTEHFEAEQAAWRELEEAREVGVTWMRENQYHLPPVEMQLRVERAHAAWNLIRMQDPLKPRKPS